jgi:hypothetical protein
LLLIQSCGARHAHEAVVTFLEALAPNVTVDPDGSLRLPAPPNALAALKIPHPYGVKGGAAREIFASLLAGRSPREPRDIDVVRRGHHRTPKDDEVARAIMPRDFALGARVELIRKVSAYLSSRDLTINEVAVIDGTLVASPLCALDTLGHVIRPSRYRGGTLHRQPGLYGQSLLKMVRLYAEGSTVGENWSITGIPEEVSFSEFDLAVHLNKAFQRGRATAEKFLHTCEILSLISATNDPVANALAELEHLRHVERGLFPDVPMEEWRALSLAER